ncbi:deaminated glutathione amidase-like isoform X2 [Rhopilema esculentum]|uniref:deaminated glutathione amidase-like isoform X2 n=1 Tax=Rhopilema esculentum TaxID=499914 RepID=UPI0031D896B5
MLRRSLVMASNCSRRLIAVCQMTSSNNKERNLEVVAQLVKEASSAVFLPECFDYVGENRSQTVELAEPLHGDTINRMKKVAAECNVWLSLGGFHEKGPLEDERKVYNSHVLIDNHGVIKEVYRKTHLFDVNMKGGAVLKESEYVIPGTCLSPPVASPVGKIGMQVCYDIRFPELSCTQAQMGADILTFPSAFTVVTGMAHWEVLLRARAIDNQCYVVAAAQVGQHTEQRRSYGHAMVVDPWGAVVSQCSEGVGFCLANLDIDYLEKVREGMPIWKHRRYDLYNNPLKT